AIRTSPSTTSRRILVITAAGAADLLGHSHHLHHLRHRVHPHDVRTSQDGGGHGGRRSPVPLPRRPVTQRFPHERLTRRSYEHGTIQPRGELGQPREHTITVRCLFGKPD